MADTNTRTLGSNLASAASIRDASNIASAHLARMDPELACDVFLVDARDGALVAVTDEDAGSGQRRRGVALDHFPQGVQRAIRKGGELAELGSQAEQYATALGMSPGAAARCSMQGVSLDGELAAVIAVTLGRRRPSARMMTDVEECLAMLSLAILRCMERDARFEAVAALHDVTTRLRAEHRASLVEIERELAVLRATSRASVPAIVRDLREVINAAELRAHDAEERAELAQRAMSEASAAADTARRMLADSERNVLELRIQVAGKREHAPIDKTER